MNNKFKKLISICFIILFLFSFHNNSFAAENNNTCQTIELNTANFNNEDDLDLTKNTYYRTRAGKRHIYRITTTIRGIHRY